jgi:aminopeptidase S
MRPSRSALVIVGLLGCLVCVAPAQEAGRLGKSLEAITGAADNGARREAIVGQLRAMNVDPVVERFGEGRGAGANIIVTLAGNAAKTIVIGAHVDRVNTGRGAVDNGAACAALIELIAGITASPLERSTLQVVFFDREEAGLLGSRAFFAAGRRVDYAINLDIFAYGNELFATASRLDGLLSRSLRAASDAAGIPLRIVPRASYPNSDHVAMMAAGVETIGVALVDTADIDGVLAIGGGRLTLGKGPRILTIIHSPNDTLDKVRTEQMTPAITVLERMIRTVDRETG